MPYPHVRQVTIINYCTLYYSQFITIDVDDINMMLLNALLPDSLVHITSKGIRFESTKSPGRNCLAGCLSIESLDGKLLKSPTAVSESVF